MMHFLGFDVTGGSFFSLSDFWHAFLVWVAVYFANKFNGGNGTK